jgi:hypothetical protein
MLKILAEKNKRWAFRYYVIKTPIFFVPRETGRLLLTSVGR